jgi:hypothetical protein
MTNPNDPAFLETFYDGEKITEGRGLTKREWFAGMAMTNIAFRGTSYETCAIDSVGYADALIKELSK